MHSHQGFVKVKTINLKSINFSGSLTRFFPNRYQRIMKTTTSTVLELKPLLKKIPDPRQARGQRHCLTSVLNIAIGALLSGCDSFTSIGEWARRSSQNRLKRLGCYFHPGQQRYLAPSEPTIRRVLQSLESSVLESILNDWSRRNLLETTDQALAIDGKTLQGSHLADGYQPQMLSAVGHELGLTIGQVKIEKNSNEIPAVRTLLDPLDIKKKVVTLDALHTQKKRPNI